jgi:hypothetical protein
VCCAVAVAWFCAASSRADDALKARFLREAPQGWGRLGESEQQVTGMLHTEWWALNDGKRNQEWGVDAHAKFQRNGDALARISYRGVRTVVLAANPRYSFKLERASDGAPYVLRYLTLGPLSTTLDEIESATHLRSLLGGSHNLLGEPLEDLIKEPGFVLKGIAEKSEGTTPTVRVDFEYDSIKRDMHDRDGWMTFVPTENWALQAAEYRPRKDWRVSILNEYRPNRNGRLALYRIQRLIRFSEQKVEENYQYTFDEIEDRAVPESAFMLTEFGLPEPSESVPYPRSRLHYWLIGGAVTLFVAGVILRRAVRRLVGKEPG